MQTVSIHFPKAGLGQIATAQLLGFVFILLHLVPVFIKVLQCAITGTSGYMRVLKVAWCLEYTDQTVSWYIAGVFFI